MSALQCPTRVLVTSPGPARALVAALRGERIARVWCDPAPDAVAAAEAVVAALGAVGSGIGVTVCEDLREGDGDGRVVAALEDLTDQHRGEAVLVVDGGGTVLAAVNRLVAGPRSPADGPLPEGAHLEVEVDGDGWRPVRRDDAP